MMAAKFATIIPTKEIPLMLKSCFKAGDAVKRLRTDKDGVASFEYVIVAACIVGTASAVFGGAGAGTLAGALGVGTTAIVTVITTAIGAA
jgi:pilus assembly protein Flp/PilA